MGAFSKSKSNKKKKKKRVTGEEKFKGKAEVSVEWINSQQVAGCSEGRKTWRWGQDN